MKYFLASSATVEQAASADPALTQIASTGPWDTSYNGETLDTTWKVYAVSDSSVVQPLADRPVVWKGVGPAQSSWLAPAVSWYDDPSQWGVVPAADGPASWERVSPSVTRPDAVAEPKTVVSAVTQTDSSISFHVDRVGTPVEVKVSYFPNWAATGAEGPWRVAPNLMVVVPTSHEVTLTYGSSGAQRVGELITLAALVAAVAVAVAGRRARRRRRSTAGAAPGACEHDGAMSRTLGMFPLSTVLFPQAGLPLHVFEERYRTLMAECLDGDGEFGVVLIARGSEVGGGDQRVDIGTVARIPA